MPNKPLWIKACKNEVQKFFDHDAFELVERPEDAGILIVSGKWVFKYKRRPNNQILKRKARYVARGLAQCYSLDYKETFASTLKFTTFRLLFALAAFFDMEIEQVDFVFAYRCSELDEIVYVEQPPRI